MMKLLKCINDKENNKYKKLKLSNVVYDKDNNLAILRFVYKQEYFTDDDKKCIQTHVEEYFNKTIKIKTKFKKYFIDEDVITINVINYIKNNFCGIAKGVKKSNIVVINENEKYKLTIKCDTTAYNYFLSFNFVEKLQDFIKKTMFDKVEICLQEKSNNTLKILEEQNKQLMKKYNDNNILDERVIVLPTDIMNLIGKIEKNKEIYLPVGQIYENENITIGGFVNYLLVNKYLSKRKNTEGEQIEKEYFTFELAYNNNSLRVIYFPRIADKEKAKLLENNKSILVNGVLEKDGDRFTLKAKNIAFARLPEIENKEIQVYKEVNSNYQLIFPKSYQVVEQQFLFVENSPVSNFLQNNTFVVFDLETTGLDSSKDEITEIGAVKIVNGELTETFSTLIKPKQIIPDFIVKMTGISNELVKDAPSIEEVLPDFYKFCHGSTIVAYNINFDYKFINHFGLKLGYKFKNKQIDAMHLARIGIPNLKRYTLKDAVNKLGINLTNAHRAMFDTVATAKLFLALSDYV